MTDAEFDTLLKLSDSTQAAVKRFKDHVRDKGDDGPGGEAERLARAFGAEGQKQDEFEWSMNAKYDRPDWLLKYAERLRAELGNGGNP